MHHVVFAVAAERLDAAVAFLAEFGFRFQTHELSDVGLLVKLDWERGVEIVTPTSTATPNHGPVEQFLERHGDGVFSVVIRVDDADASAELARRYGVSAEFRQDRSGDGLELVEVQLASIFGMPLTLLSTNLP